MTVLLTVSETLNGAAVNDSLAGGGSGVDLGSVVNDSYAPVIDKSANTGKQDLYIKADNVIDPITDVKFFIQEYGVGTGFTYGGAKTASEDYTQIKLFGSASGTSKNNADHVSGGFWMDMKFDSGSANQFDTHGAGLTVIFGKSDLGISLETAYGLKKEALVKIGSVPEAAPSAPVDGQIGVLGDATLGDSCHLKFRIYVPKTYDDGGIVQWELVTAYSFTA